MTSWRILSGNAARKDGSTPSGSKMSTEYEEEKQDVNMSILQKQKDEMSNLMPHRQM